jgi:hypothetical protein
VAKRTALPRYHVVCSIVNGFEKEKERASALENRIFGRVAKQPPEVKIRRNVLAGEAKKAFADDGSGNPRECDR